MMRNLIFSMILILFTLAIIAGMLVAVYPQLEYRYKPELVRLMAMNLTDSEKQAIYDRLAQNHSRIWDVVPEPNVGRIALPNISMVYSEAEVDTNNAGMRSVRPYTEKAQGVYRIVCLGDSYVMGEAGLEQDRWCDQLEALFTQNNITIDGKPVEALAVGLSSWTMQQEATYLTSRMSAYDPDLILMMTVGNDITPSMGVTGLGILTNEFSSEEREWGSALFNNAAGWAFNWMDISAINNDLSATGNAMWDNYMVSVKRLAEIQHRRGGKILFSVLTGETRFISEFDDNYRKHFIKAGIKAPQMTIISLITDEYRLPHDGHPNRRGHEILRDQYLHALVSLGWLQLPDDVELSSLPDNFPPLQFNQPPASNEEQWRQEFLDRLAVVSDIDFSALTNDRVTSFLGGIFPAHHIMENRYSETPYASIRAGFMLRTLKNQSKQQVSVSINIPDKAELFPLEITMTLDNLETRKFVFEKPGAQTLEMTLPDTLANKPVVEVVFVSNHYFTGIEDHRMKVFKLERATVKPL